MFGSMLQAKLVPVWFVAPLHVSQTHIKHHVFVPPACIGHHALAMPICLAIFDVSMCFNTLVPTFVPCLGAHGHQGLLSMPMDQSYYKALPYLAHINHAPICLFWSNCYSGFLCHA